MANKAADIYKDLICIDETEARIQIDLSEDKLPLALCIELPGEYVSELVPAGTQLPINTTKMFSTADSFQMAAEFHILLGNRPLARDNYDLCRIRVRNIKWSGAGVPEIELHFEINKAGLITISATNLDRDNAEILVFMAQESISHEEIESALAQAQEHESTDEAIRELIQRSLDCYALIGVTNDYYSAAKRKLGSIAKYEYRRTRKRLENALSVGPAAATVQSIEELLEAEKAFREQRQKILPIYKQVMAWYK